MNMSVLGAELGIGLGLGSEQGDTVECYLDLPYLTLSYFNDHEHKPSDTREIC